MFRSPPPPPDQASQLRKRLFALFMGLIVAAAASRLWLLPIHFSNDPNEGWNAYQAVRAMGAGPLYPPPGSLISNNYPPLSFFIVGAAGRVIGDPIVAGRIVALLSVIGVALLLFAILRRLGARTPIPRIGALLFLALNATVLRDYLALDDPQWLGHSLVMSGVLVLVPKDAAKTPGSGPIILAALLMILGGLCKQNLIGWPIAVTLWLGWHHRRACAWWIACGVIGGAGALLAGHLVFGPAFLADLLGTARIYSLDRIVHRAGGAVLVMAVLLWWSWPALRRGSSDPRRDLIRLAVLVTVPLGVVERGGAGVHFNAHFEAAIALCLSAALAFDHRRMVTLDRRLAEVALAALFVAGFALELGEVRKFPARHAAWQAMEDHLLAVRGDVACETQALCFWAGQPFGIDFFLYSQTVRETGDAGALDRALAGHRFAATQVNADPPPGNPDRASDPVLLRLAAAMHPVFVDASGRTLLMPVR